MRNVFHCDHTELNDLSTNMTFEYMPLVAVLVEMTFGRELYIRRKEHPTNNVTISFIFLQHLWFDALSPSPVPICGVMAPFRAKAIDIVKATKIDTSNFERHILKKKQTYFSTLKSLER